MSTTLEAVATEGSTYIVTVSFTDEDGSAVAPYSVKWTLADSRGEVVNGRENVEIATPASSLDIVLKGDDVQITPPIGKYLLLTIDAEYDSALGAALPLLGQCKIPVQELEP